MKNLQWRAIIKAAQKKVKKQFPEIYASLVFK